MQDKIKSLIAEVEIFTASTKEQLEEFRLKYLSKKGILTDLFAEMKNIQPDQRKSFGQMVNELKIKAEEKLSKFQSALEDSSESAPDAGLDLTLPSEPNPLGSRHPISLTRNRILDIFKRIGFTVADGPEIEDDWHNFTALNFPENHPARDMQDTFLLSTAMEVILLLCEHIRPLYRCASWKRPSHLFGFSRRAGYTGTKQSPPVLIAFSIR